MTRRHFTFACEGVQLAATLDDAPAETGLLLITGGNEVRGGAWNGQALFAARIAEAGFPVLRFDRRGVGDSEGPNGGFRSSEPDIAAALAAFREQCPQVRRVIGFGNCDAASALMLSKGDGFDALVLSNPWTIESDDEEAPAEVVRDHYRRRLADPAAIKRLLTGQVAIGKLVRSLISAVRPAPQAPNGLAAEIGSGLAAFEGSVRFLIAGRDRTGLAFLSKWDKADPRLRTCAEATHSYVEPKAQAWLVAQVLEVLRG
ncbi:hydrolase 1, exosortase A system-associated [Novosphingobium mangrovi (ex Huang et al. 2023)]|uniref:Hydrolase 1, exosortase A system-associated n=1 Tax=Novosphingobium mangrovi (ex Huang et al. 2023) TaxID=2976432 RepID=A0ABT2I595_9SPHN|nr:hydrolase 1, exosortase A system-associated [Novosphingobium mangrovi (ex Huang et al. 2023)]MCT2399970.1 hydrolase 1, exosortase A system-associated [Novosphingobium mangrovi (ex Huang et al. 2023)]